MSQPDLIAAYDTALAAVGDRYDGLEDAVNALADLVKQHPSLAAARLNVMPEIEPATLSETTLGEDLAEVEEYIEELGVRISRLEMFPPVEESSR
jgi:nitrogenase molybdenum-iron protein alpha/beta subunit